MEQGLGRRVSAPNPGRDLLVSVTKWVINVEWTFTVQMKMRNAASAAANECVWIPQRLTRKLKQSPDSARNHGWVKKVYAIAVGICAREMLIAREVKFVVSMAAKRTVSTLVSLLSTIVLALLVTDYYTSKTKYFFNCWTGCLTWNNVVSFSY